jgi:hypothetical protein
MDRMGILTGSFFAAVIGYAVTAMASRKPLLADLAEAKKPRPAKPVGVCFTALGQ